MVNVTYGGGKGTVQVHQDLEWVPGGAEPGDRFGFSLVVFDEDEDHCDDLVVGIPHEDIGTVRDSGTVHVIYGSPAGLGQGRASKAYDQSQSAVPGAEEADDLFGFAVAAGPSSWADNGPFLAIGVPGEDIGTVREAGAVAYWQRGQFADINQDTTDVPGAAEAEDRFGAALAGDNWGFAVGSPGEAIGDQAYAGMVTLFQHPGNSETYAPQPRTGLSQDTAGVGGGAESGDGFGTALSMKQAITHTETGALRPVERLAVGVPGEDLLSSKDTGGVGLPDAGSVQVFEVSIVGSVTQLNWVDQNTSGVDDASESGDHFGQRVEVNGYRLAVGVPGEDTDGAIDAGAVHVFKDFRTAGDSDVLLTRDSELLPGAATARDLLGLALRTSGSDLYIGVPYSKAAAETKGVVIAVPWTNLTSGGTDPVRTIQPGVDGVPANAVTFGTAIQ